MLLSMTGYRPESSIAEKLQCRIAISPWRRYRDVWALHELVYGHSPSRGRAMSTMMHDLGIDQMNPEDRLRLIGEIWDSLPEPDPARIPQSHREELDRRLAAAESNPEAAAPWEEVRARLRGKQ